MNVDLAALIHLVVAQGYPIFFALMVVASAGVPLPAGLVLVGLGAASAQRGGPDFVLLAASGIAGSIAGDALNYGLGRLSGPGVSRWAHRRLRGSPLLTSMDQLGSPPRLTALVFFSRFALTPLATPASLMAGISRLAFYAFLAADAIGEGVFVVGNLSLGRFLSANNTLGWPLVLASTGVALAGWLIFHPTRRASPRQPTQHAPPVMHETVTAPVTHRCRSDESFTGFTCEESGWLATKR